MHIRTTILFGMLLVSAMSQAWAVGSITPTPRSHSSGNGSEPQVITEQAEFEQLAHQYHVAASPAQRAHIRQEQIDLEWSHFKHELPLLLQLKGGVAGMGEVDSESAAANAIVTPAP